MSKVVAFDVDGIIWSDYPVPEMMRAFKKDGWKVLVLSPNPMDDILRKLKEKQVEEYVDEIVNRGDKGAVCKEYNVDVFIDDNPGYIQQAVEQSPKTMSLYRVPSQFRGVKVVAEKILWTGP